MYPKRFLFIIVCLVPSWLFSQIDTADCSALSEIIRIVSTKTIRDSDGGILDSTSTQKNYVLKYHLFDLDSIEELTTTQYVKSTKIVHTERFFASENLQAHLVWFDELVGKLHHFCLQEWDKTTLKDVSGEKGYLHKVLFTNFEDETTVAILFLETSKNQYTTQLQIFN
jgi:hypothetical protein